ncbi:sugar ABC transporter ATP-binding protein [Pseudalkalibacillus salsuginis]|uniref:sugar ABC transporter ATP-binding protein n=1 Tax=Pseudalkalibacillus salsuginis TaxID=2910972 RepID=UPI001F40FF08|nr:sugar ABC transporter ATP-binding protein [Pseudalkalibacillus salsuginis]MCF6411395.1 sugar ABC transporter ATP-binding protein [Pseudalkalibacillus salsuginis]
MNEMVLELRDITKEFPGVKALDSVQFELKRGEIHALMGENGAGKSTFIKVITGVHTPDDGEIFLNGEKVDISNTKEAQKLGIAAIYQHVTNYPHLSITENIYMGHEKINKKTRKIRWKEMHQDAKKLLESLGSNLDPKTTMGSLSVAQQQIVEIAKALSTDANIIIMDEPTAALTHRESKELYRITEGLRDDGVSIIFISHRFEDMYRLADRVTVFRDSEYIGTWNVDGISNEKLIVAMVGREINQLFPKKEANVQEELLKVKNLGQMGRFADISFTLHKGEILGITGLVGAGRSELSQALFGIEPYDSGEVYFHGKRVEIKNPSDAIQLGIGYLPEDRQEQSLILDWEIGRNITLSCLEEISTKGWLNERKERSIAKKLAEKVNVKTGSIFNPAKSLSGGNQQKVSVAKLLTTDLEVLIFDEPTKGVDIGAKSAIYEIIVDLANQGYGVILISSEMPEVIGLSDRIAVMCEGRITRVIAKEEATQEAILEAAMSKERTVSAS